MKTMLYFQIPSLNDTPLHNLKPNSLVRFRCMIQDMFDPEFYLGIYEVEDKKTGEKAMKSGKYKDVAECGVISFLSRDISGMGLTCERTKCYGTNPILFLVGAKSGVYFAKHRHWWLWGPSMFSSPGQSPRRAVELPHSLTTLKALASESASTSTQRLKFFWRPHIFQTTWRIWFMFGMMMDIGPKCYSAVPSTHLRPKSRSWT